MFLSISDKYLLEKTFAKTIFRILKMANYIVKFDLDYFNSVEELEAEISSADVTIVSKLSFPGTYIVSAQNSDVAANLTGALMSEAADTVVSAKLQSFTTTHIDMLNDGYAPGTTLTPQYSGAGQEVYLIDTGIQESHPEFTGASISNLHSNFDGDYADVAGHGTAVGSLIVGQNIGVAPNAALHNVKLFNANQGDITVGEIIMALDAVLTHHNTTASKAKVVCMPWTITKNAFVDSKITEMNQGNLVVVVAAGNDGIDVDSVSPAGVDQAITVGAVNSAFEVTAFTNVPFSDSGTYNNNFGAQLDIFAAGVDVSHAAIAGDYATGDGTSLSTGIVAGAALHYIQKNPSATATSIKDTMLSEGHTHGSQVLTFDNASGIDYSGVYRSIALVDAQGVQSFATAQSGRIANIKIMETATIDIGLNPAATNVTVLEFAPTPEWIQFDAATGIVSIDAAVPESLAPGSYIFAIKGEMDGNLTVEEYSVGLYVTEESELDGGASSYYFDPDTDSYDEVVNYQVAPQKF